MESTNAHQSLHAWLKSKKVFVFDWDGTVLDSMPMKSQNFVQAFKSVIPEIVKQHLTNKVAELYLRLSGHPRKYIYFEILNLLNLEITQISYDQFNAAFEVLNKRNLIHANLFPDATELLRALIDGNCPIFISSSVPQNELVDLVDAILPNLIRQNVSAVLGSIDGFSKGKNHLQWIMNETGATNAQLLVIGDDVADYELSFAAGVDSILVDRQGTLRESKINAVSDLYQIRDLLRNEIQGAC